MKTYFAFWLAVFASVANAAEVAPVTLDLSGFREESRLTLTHIGENLRLTWPASATENGVLELNLKPNKPLFEVLAIGPAGQPPTPLLRQVAPVTFLTIGERDLKNPAGWVAFFDNPPLRSYRTVPVVLTKKTVRVTTSGSRTLVHIGEVAAGSFRGAMEITVFRHSPLVLVEAVVSTEEEGRAILYDAGLMTPTPAAQAQVWRDPAAPTYSPLAPGPGWKSLAWLDAAGQFQRTKVEPNRIAAPLTVSRRMLVAENDGGSIAIFPPPHQYFYPLDSANNLGFVWHGAARSEFMSGYGFGIRQPPEGDRIWVPWVNAPRGTEQRLGVFYLLATGDASRAIDQVSRFTRDDRYKKLPGYLTFTSHYHIEHTLEFAKAQTDQRTNGIPAGLQSPGFVRTFKTRGVDIVHLAEFHVGSSPRMAAEDRLPLLKLLHDECARLSDADLLVLPGEEPNVHLGGHWLSFFPKPVYWVLNRTGDRPFVEDVTGYGRVYHVGSADDVLRLMESENGLMWTAHARIKGSRTFPDAYWEKPYFRSERFLGAAWKAMPADLSLPRLGARVLDLLDEMSNAGLRKYALAEADLFRMEPDYETYAHMNINYVQLERLPRFGDGWHSLLNQLRAGKFFVTTGEVLIPRFELKREGHQSTMEADLEWTFPLAFAELISGDGKTVNRQRIELTETEGFGTKTVRLPSPPPGSVWTRLEVWDAARNGAFTQPLWLEKSGSPRGE
jgi:hypothetical protein